MKEQPAYYAVIPAGVRYDTALPANAKLMYGELSALANVQGYCSAGNSYFAELYKSSIKTVSRWISQLQKAGYISVEVVRNEKNEVVQRRIFLRDVPQEQQLYPSPQNCGDPPLTEVTPSPQNCPDPPRKNAEENITSINNTRESARAKECFGEMSNVMLTQEEYDKLLSRVPQEGILLDMIDQMSCHMASTGKHYKSHYATLLNWLRRAGKLDEDSGKSKGGMEQW